jgi:hypothetical protein
MINIRRILFEKLQDLLTLETRAGELYEMALVSPRLQSWTNELANLRREELEHASMVKELLNLVKPYSSQLREDKHLTQRRYCQACGRELSQNAKYCDRCGTKTDDVW